MKNSTPVFIYFNISLGIQFLTVTLYMLTLGNKYLKITQKHHKITEQIDIDNKENFRKKFIYNLIIILIFINMFILSFPNRLLSYKVIFNSLIGKKITNQTALVLAILNIILDIVLEVIQHILMQTRLPIHKYIPFALADPKLQYYVEMVLYLFAIGNALPEHIAVWCNTTLALFAFMSYFTFNTYYDTLANHAAKMRQTSLLSSIIISAVNLGRPEINSYVYIIFLVFFVVNFFLLKLFYMMKSKRKILYESNNMQTARDGQILIWCIESLLLVNQDTKTEQIKAIFIKIQTILSMHKQQCSDPNCFCQKPKYEKILEVRDNSQVTFKNFHKLKIMTLEILLRKVFDNENKNQIQKNCKLGIILVFEVFQSKKTPFSCMYNLQKFHDCSTCSLTDCFQQYIIQRMMIFHVNSYRCNVEDIQKYQWLINFEQNLKRYLEVIDQTIEGTKNIWSAIEKNEIDIKQATKYGQQLVEKYKEFNEVYLGMNQMCGEVILIESIALRLHREILQFEQEAFINQDKIIQIRSKQRLMRQHEQEQNFFGKEKNHLVVIGGNQKNFQQILNVSKSFVTFVGFTYEFLMKNKCCCFLPKVIEYEHENILKKYLKKKSILNQKVLLKEQWLKSRNGNLKPVTINVIPRIDINDGITMVALVSKQKEIAIFDASVKSNSVFCMICDLNNKIAHVSENCLAHLGFVENIEVHDIYLTTIISGLPEQLTHDQIYTAVLDVTPMLAFTGDTHQITYSSRVFTIMIHYSERVFSPLSILKQIIFVVVTNPGTVSMDFTSEQIFGAPNIQLFGSDGKKTISFDKPTTLLAESSEEEDVGSMQSLSSTSSRSSSHNTQETQIMEIKSFFEFENLPYSLRKFRIHLIIGFVILLSTAIALMVVNIESKTSFVVDIDSLREMKIMKNTLSITKLAITYIMAYANIPKSINTTLMAQTNIYVDSYEAVFFNNLRDQIDKLHLSLTEFSQNSAFWDSNFVYLVSKDELVADKVTYEGNHVQVNTTFFKTMILYVDDISFLEDIGYSYYKFNNTINFWNSTNSVSWFMKVIKGQKDPVNTLLQYFFLCVYNGAGFLFRQILNIDTNFLQQILNHGDKIINVIMIFTVTCCIVIFIVVALYIPYLFRVFTVHKQILEFICLSDRNQLKNVVNQCIIFQKFLRKNIVFNQLSENNLTKKGEQVMNKFFKSSISTPQIKISSVGQQEQENQTTTTQQNVQSTNQNMVTANNNEENNEQIRLAFIKEKKKQLKLNLKKEKQMDQTLNPNDSSIANNTQVMMLKKQLHTSDEEEDEDEDAPQDAHHGEVKKKKDMKIEILSNIDYSKINIQTNIRKIVTISILLIIAIVVGAFYIATYIISKDVLESYQVGFYQYDIFFTRSSCISETYFLTQKAILFNDSLTDDTEIGRNLDYMMTQCLTNENNYREIKKSGDGMFKSIDTVLKTFDSSGLCDYLITQLDLDSRCSIEGNGVMSLGLEQIIASYLSQIQQIKIKYTPGKYTSELQTAQLFFQKESFSNVIIFFKYILKAMEFIEEKAHESLSTKMDDDFVKIVVIFVIFIVVVLLLSVVIVIRLVEYLKFRLLSIKVLLKLMPSEDILKLKKQLEKINTTIL